MDLKQAREMQRLLAEAGRKTVLEPTGPNEFCLRAKRKGPKYPYKKPKSIWSGTCCRAF